MADPRKFVIADFKVESNFVILIRYVDGKTQRIDFGDIKQRGDWKELGDLNYFNQVFLNERGNLEWPRGQDFKPEHLYYWEKYMHLYTK